jgi:hypothetical protein
MPAASCFPFVRAGRTRLIAKFNEWPFLFETQVTLLAFIQISTVTIDMKHLILPMIRLDQDDTLTHQTHLAL